MVKRTPADDAAMRPWVSVARMYFLCDTLMARRLGALGVRTAEHEILANLRRDPGIAQQTLAQRCFTAKSHISALLSALEGRGWVRREADPADARAKRLFLTAAGERMAVRTAAVQDAVAAAMAGSVSPKALADLTAAMLRISERLQDLLDQPV
ncbi:MAG: MarR family transcriptional regulator [Pseudomonadota bacterium]